MAKGKGWKTSEQAAFTDHGSEPSNGRAFRNPRRPSGLQPAWMLAVGMQYRVRCAKELPEGGIADDRCAVQQSSPWGENQRRLLDNSSAVDVCCSAPLKNWMLSEKPRVQRTRSSCSRCLRMSLWS